MKKTMQRFLKVFLLVVAISIGLCDACLAAKQEVFQLTVSVPVTEAQTNVTLNIERYGKVILDASANTNSETYAWKFLEGPKEVILLKTDSLSPYFRPPVPGVYRFALEVNNNGAVIETKEITLTVRDLYFVEIKEPDLDNTMNIYNYLRAYPIEWMSQGPLRYITGALTTDIPNIDITGSAELHTVTLQCKNITTGAQYSGALLNKKYQLEFSFKGIVLQEGDNVIEVTGIDDLGIICQDKRFITYTPSIKFTKPLELTPSVIVECDNKEVEFSLQIKFEENNPIPSKIDLYETTASGDLMQKIGELNLISSPEQGVYSAKIILQGNKGYKYYRAVLGNNQKSITAEFYCIPAASWDTEERKRAKNIIRAIKQEVMNEGAIDGKVRTTLGDFYGRIEKIAEIITLK
jgi:hypothetical protein